MPPGFFINVASRVVTVPIRVRNQVVLARLGVVLGYAEDSRSLPVRAERSTTLAPAIPRVGVNLLEIIPRYRAGDIAGLGNGKIYTFTINATARCSATVTSSTR